MIEQVPDIDDLDELRALWETQKDNLDVTVNGESLRAAITAQVEKVKK